MNCIGTEKGKRVKEGLEEEEKDREKSMMVIVMLFVVGAEEVEEEKRCNDEMGLVGLPNQGHEDLLRIC